MNAAQLVGLLFLGRNVAHSVHLNTRSFSKHMALNTFYDEVIDRADAFAEAYQGRHGLIGPIAIPASKKTAKSSSSCKGNLMKSKKVVTMCVQKRTHRCSN
jgi:hypothetical protein